MNILFVDGTTPKPYTVADLEVSRMGGTEATCLRVIRELSHRHSIMLLQRGRTDIVISSFATYASLDHKPETTPDVVVTLRDAKLYRTALQSYPNSLHYLWMHDVVSGDYAQHLSECLSDGEVHKLLAVSQWHANQIYNALPNLTLAGALNIQVMYNPIETYCVRTQTQYNPKQLIFYSSPHKGLDDVLDVFSHLRTHDPDMKLLVANPGYYEDKKDLPAGVETVQLPHRLLMEKVRESLCMFYPQITFEETFGLVYAESNALGTPVLAHNLGAAAEVLDHNNQIIDCRNVDKVIKTALDWSKGGRRPTVSGSKLFSMGEVIKTWEKLIRFGSVA